MLPRLGTSQLVSSWILATLAASVAGAIDPRFAAWCALIPSRVIQGEVWRVFTWPFVEPGVMGLVLTCVAIFKFGSELASMWGDRRLRRFMIEVLVGATVLTCVLALVTGNRYMVRLGGWAITEALVIAWARQFPSRPLVLYGMLTVQGPTLIKVTLGVVVLFAIFAGPVTMGLELFACLIALGYPSARMRR